MLITIIAWIYITFLSYSWGKLFLNLVSKSLSSGETNNIHPTITCFSGIILIAAGASLLSFFLPLGAWYIQLFFLMPVAFNSKWIFLRPNMKVNLWRPVNILLFICCLVTVLIMSTFTISHPDTLGYHIQIIKWIEEYKIVPGIANLNTRLGFQSNWFILCALFNFKFIGTGSYVYLNSLATLWVLFFVISKINQCITERKQKELWLWIGFIILTISSYTQVPLTATSASPDYIAAIYTWLALYYLFNSEHESKTSSFIFVIVFSFFAFCIKLSTVPIVIAGAYSLIRLLFKRKIKAAILSTTIAAIVVLCFLARNAVTSGYMLYPSTFPNIVNNDWKVPEKKAQRERAYVTAFARTESGASNQDIAFTNKMKVKEWLPVWWSKRTLSDKVILLLTGLSCIILIFSRKKIQKQQPKIIISLITAVIGVIFWFLMGPDPRFGFGFIIGLIGVSLSTTLSQKIFELINRKLIFVTLSTLSVILAVYIVHRFNNYFSPKQLIHAAGVKLEPASSINCEETIFYMAAPLMGCGANPIPCIEDSCKYFFFRGNNISDGFKPKKAY